MDMSSSTTTGERPTEGGQRSTYRWPPFSGLAWEICILVSSNDAYMRELALTVLSGHEDRDAPDQMSTDFDLEAPDGGKTPR
jgi:hypothetical protein